jgi:hypothetical protein
VVGTSAAVLASCINFAPAESSRTSTIEDARTVDVVFVDVTGDGSDDPIVAVGLPDGDALVRMAPCGDGCLERREEIPLGAEVNDLGAADFNGDNIVDVAVATSAGVSVYFGASAQPERPEGLAADDFVVADQATRADLVAADLNDDGHADLGVSDNVGYGFIPGDGIGGFGSVVEPLANGSIVDLAAGDIDGDGDLEVLYVFNFNILGRPASAIVAWRDGISRVFAFLTDGTLQRLSTADLDGDQLDDVAVSEANQVRMYRSTGTGLVGFGPGGVATTLPVGAVDLELRDIDLDAKVDFMASDGNQLSWWHGVGSGQFAARVNRAAGPGPANFAFGNVGGSLRADLVLGSATAPFAEVSYLTNSSQL